MLPLTIDPMAVRTAAPRSRSTHGSRSETAGAPVRERRVARHEPRSDTPRSAREQEREEAYARNPDQPLPQARAHAKGDAPSALVHHAAGHGHRAHKARPVPALLMKRKAPETQGA